MGDIDSDPAVSVCFSVKIDDHDLGAFTACDGLGCEVVIEQREEGGNQRFVHQLPGRLKFPNVKLTRPINKDTEKVAKWFARMSGPVARTGAEIVAMTLDGTKVATWQLMDVIPVRWSGPQLGVDNSKVATETLEIAHHGFMG
ncbi:MAG: phage tail protein [Actinomycetota bacterium]|nr:phage tail protein [Actinomycetota bacterium]